MSVLLIVLMIVSLHLEETFINLQINQKVAG